MLTPAQFFYPLPVFVLSATVTLLMLSIAFYRNKMRNTLIVLGGLALALLTTHPLTLDATKNISELVILDRFACFFIVLMIFATFVCISLAHSYLQKTDDNREEMYLLMALSLIGGVVLVSSHHFASLFIGLEILSVPIYALVAYNFKNTRSLESGIKYLVLSATGSALMLFGIALLYAYSGTLSFSGITEQLATTGQTQNSLVLIGALLITIALCFKLSLAPFHLWTPDVYEGSPAPVSAFIATVAKIAVAAVMVRLITDMPIFQGIAIKQTLMILAALSMLIGNILAITQNNIKRLFAYSSISHFGYLLVGIISLHVDIRETSMIYILVYALTSLAAFGVISLTSSPLIGNDADNLAINYQGLYKKQPLLAIIMTIAMLSMAGIPLTAGFIGKFYVIAAGINASLWSLLAIMVIGSAIGIYYYLRVTIALFKVNAGFVSSTGESITQSMEKENITTLFNKFVLLFIALVIVLLGVYPQPIFEIVSNLAN